MPGKRKILRMGSGTIATVVAVLAMDAWSVPPALAQERSTLPPVVVEAPKPRAGSNDHKGAADNGDANAKGGGDASFKDLNQRLKRKVDEVNPTANNPPLDASSPDTKIGVVNIPGVQQQYGKNFGNSVIPYRPPPPVFAPLGARR